MKLVSRLDKIAAAVTAKQSCRQEIVRRIMGDQNAEEVLNRMVASGNRAPERRRAIYPKNIDGACLGN
jgi:hypothetical protein